MISSKNPLQAALAKKKKAAEKEKKSAAFAARAGSFGATVQHHSSAQSAAKHIKKRATSKSERIQEAQIAKLEKSGKRARRPCTRTETLL